MSSIVPDIFPNPVQFDVDWDRTQRYLSLADAKYKQGVQRIRTFYDSIFNAPMLGEDNIARRDEYLRGISEQLKNGSHLDFSQLQNQEYIYNLITPITSDVGIAKDIQTTADLQKKLQKQEQLRTSSDPATRRRYSEDYVKALNFVAEDFRNATPEERLSMSLPSYVENIDLMSYANKLYKDYGISVKQDKSSGGYIWTQKNGDIAVPLTESIVSDILSNDPAVKSMMQLSAFVDRREGIEQRLPKFNNDFKIAEKDYLNEVFNSLKGAHTKKLETDFNHVKELKQKVSNLESKIKTRGIIRGSDEHKEYLNAITELELAERAANNYRDNAFDFSTIDQTNVNDLKNAVDKLNTSSQYINLGNQLAQFLAFKNSELTMKVDPLEQVRLTQQLMYEREKQMAKIRAYYNEELVKLKKSLGVYDKENNDDQETDPMKLFNIEEFDESGSGNESDPFSRGANSNQGGNDDLFSDEEKTSDDEANTEEDEETEEVRRYTNAVGRGSSYR